MRFVLALSAAALSLSAIAASAADLTLTLKDNKFSPAELPAPAGEALTITVINQDPTPAEFESKPLKIEKVIAPNSQAVIKIKPQKPGSYDFVEEFHEDVAKGTLVVK